MPRSNICDRCGCVVIQAPTLLTVVAGPLRSYDGYETIALCRDCGDRLRDWMRGPEDLARPHALFPAAAGGRVGTPVVRQAAAGPAGPPTADPDRTPTRTEPLLAFAGIRAAVDAPRQADLP